MTGREIMEFVQNGLKDLDDVERIESFWEEKTLEPPAKRVEFEKTPKPDPFKANPPAQRFGKGQPWREGG